MQTTLKKSKKPTKNIHWGLEFFSKCPPFDVMKIKVVQMSSNLESFYEILNQANTESFSYLSHVEPKNLQGCHKTGAR